MAIDANLIYKIKRTSGAGAPLEAEASEDHFKLLFLDIGLMQSLLGLDKEIATSFDIDSIASGALAEQFVGQELLMSLELYRRKNLYYWEKSGAKDSAEIDYLQNISGLIYPIEVKAGKRGKLKSMHSFMQKYKPSLGLRLYGGKIDYEDALDVLQNLDQITLALPSQKISMTRSNAISEYKLELVVLICHSLSYYITDFAIFNPSLT